MKLPIQKIQIVLLACLVSLSTTGCNLTKEVDRAVGKAISATIARNDTGAVAGKSEEARKEAVQELEAIKAQFAQDEEVRNDAQFRIAMVHTSGGLRVSAEAAWSVLEASNPAKTLTADQLALYQARRALVFLFSKPSENLDAIETGRVMKNAEKPDAPAAIEGFRSIAESNGTSESLQIYGAYHRTYLALRLRNETRQSEPSFAAAEAAFQAAKGEMERIWRASLPADRPNQEQKSSSPQLIVAAGAEVAGKIAKLRQLRTYSR